MTQTDAEKRLRKKLQQWKKLSKAQEKMLVAYRVQTRVPLAAIDAAREARDKLRELGEMP